MFSTVSRIRVRYAETDRMGYAYYGNYATWFEVARVEALREIGISYRSLEDDGILLPVVEFNIRYSRPALYDDELIIKTTIPELPSARIHFDYEVFRGEEFLCKAWTDLVFVDRKTNRPVRCPQPVLTAIQPWFQG